MKFMRKNKMGKCEIYRNEAGTEFVDICLPYTEFSRYLYTEDFILNTLEKALQLRNDPIIIIKEFKRLLTI